MNERIQELMKLCIEQVYDSRTGSADKLNAEKFAELIVREAIEKIESIGFKSSNDIPFETTELFVSQIKQHFGVEE